MVAEHSEPVAPTAPSRWTWRRGLLLVAALLGLIAVAAVVWLVRYEPLATGSSFAPGPVLRQVPSAEDSLASMLDDEFAVMDYEDGGSFSLGVSVANDGRLPVTLEGLADEDPGRTRRMLFDDLELAEPYLMSEADKTPFHPVTIDPGDELWFVVNGHFAGDCTPFGDDGGFATYSRLGVPLRFSYAKIFHGTQTVPFPYRLTVVCGPTQ